MLTKFNKIFCKSVYLLNLLVYYDEDRQEKAINANNENDSPIITFSGSKNSLHQCFLPMDIDDELYAIFLFNQENLFFGFEGNHLDQMRSANYLGTFDLLWFYNKLIEIKRDI